MRKIIVLFTIVLLTLTTSSCENSDPEPLDPGVGTIIIETFVEKGFTYSLKFAGRGPGKISDLSGDKSELTGKNTFYATFSKGHELSYHVEVEMTVNKKGSRQGYVELRAKGFSTQHGIVAQRTARAQIDVS